MLKASPAATDTTTAAAPPPDECGEDARDQEHQGVGGVVQPGAQRQEHGDGDGERHRPHDQAADGAALRAALEQPA